MQPAQNCISVVSSKSSNKVEPWYNVGWVKDAHGLRGEFYIKLKAKSADWLSEASEIRFASERQAPQVFDIERAKPFKEGLILKAKGIDDRTAAERWRGALVEISAELLTSEPGERVYLAELLGSTVFDGEHEIGRVEGFASNGPQDLLQVRRLDGGEALIPLIDAFIVKIDSEAKRIEMDLPPGLVDIEKEK